MDIKELTRRNADSLKKAIGEKLTCPMCHHKDFVVVGGYIHNDIQTEMYSWVTGSAVALNMAVAVCQHCGFVSHHEMGILQKQLGEEVPDAANWIRSRRGAHDE